uniref:Uncharacterized protein n=1 Tax=Candidatus Phytoplasma australasiaticum subsp. australasiaticum TaxID=2832407 RepID=A0A7S7FZE3_9MOLU|nr:hypothetical protein H7685_02140 ['Parthenium hysterophorus' phyllody phytoplasma]
MGANCEYESKLSIHFLNRVNLSRFKIIKKGGIMFALPNYIIYIICIIIIISVLFLQKQM